MFHKKAGLKLFLFFVLIILVLLLVILEARIWLFFKFLLGNDVIMTINADKNELYLKHGEIGEISFDVKVTANLFCTVRCNTQLRDVGSNMVIKQELSTSRLGIPVHKVYTIKALKNGEGQDLYRFEIECTGQKTYLCDTSDTSKSQAFLFRVLYNLSDEEQAAKKGVELKFRETIIQLENANTTLNLIKTELEKINNTLETDEFYSELSDMKIIFDSQTENLLNVRNFWNNKDYIESDNQLIGLRLINLEKCTEKMLQKDFETIIDIKFKNLEANLLELKAQITKLNENFYSFSKERIKK